MKERLRQHQKGDPEAWQEVYPQVWGVALAAASRAHASLSTEDAEDVAISAITALMDHVARLKDLAELNPLVATIAHHQAITLARRKFSAKGGSGRVESLDENVERLGDAAEASHSATPDFEVHKAQMATLLHEALGRVKAIHRDLLVDRYLNALDYRELAAKHRLNEGTVGVYLKRGAEELRKVLSRTPRLLKEMQEAFR